MLQSRLSWMPLLMTMVQLRTLPVPLFPLVRCYFDSKKEEEEEEGEKKKKQLMQSCEGHLANTNLTYHLSTKMQNGPVCLLKYHVVRRGKTSRGWLTLTLQRSDGNIKVVVGLDIEYPGTHAFVVNMAATSHG